MILDENLEEIFYWPIANLVEGGASESIIINVPTPSTKILIATSDARVIIWAKWLQFPLNPFTNINDGTGINLSGIPGPYGVFEIYAEALSISEAFVRVPISIMTANKLPAGWKL